ncbi:Pentatricopeptide repeat [Dillenia turbinata]|uniref:Pentatricopeptide repeat n=1 Tax=Dillenia turbinata TaxID=194707 RepID=A0AAN8UQJ4_9MAGN
MLMRGHEQGNSLTGLWNPRERKCFFLLQRNNTRSSLLQIYAFILRNGLESNINLLTKFISSIAVTPFGGIFHARRVFDQRTDRNDTFLCNTIIKSYVGIRQFSESFILYKDLRRETSFIPDNFTFSSLARSCALDLAFKEGQQLHNHVVKNGYGLDLFVSTAFVDMYGKFGEMGCARKLFDEMSERSQVSWTALFVGYVRCGDISNASELFSSMPEKDSAAYNAMIDAYVKLGDMSLARELFEAMPERNVVSWTTMISGYCNNGDVDSARLLFDEMPEKNLFSWNAIIGGYSQNKQPQEALRMFNELQAQTGFEPDKVTIVSILPAIADLGALELGEWVHHFARKKNLDQEINVGTALVDMYAKCGEITKAKKVFEGMPEKQTATWNALINGFAVNGHAKEALEAFSEMRYHGFKPNGITMIGVLSACNHNGFVKEGRRWFKAMEEFGLTPQIEHYGCLIDLLGRAGCLDEAEKLIERMPYKINGIILSSFLVACQNDKNVTKAEQIVKKAIEMEPSNDGNYVILRNLYARERRWKDVKEIKGLMGINGVKKEAGCSLIEVNRRVCEFVAGDRVHPQREALTSVLEHLWMHMRGQKCLVEVESQMALEA